MPIIKPDGLEQLVFFAIVLPNVKQIGQLDFVLFVTRQIERHVEPLQALTVNQCFCLSIVKPDKVPGSFNE